MGWLSKLKSGLKSSSEKISGGVSGILSKNAEEEILEEEQIKESLLQDEISETVETAPPKPPVSEEAPEEEEVSEVIENPNSAFPTEKTIEAIEEIEEAEAVEAAKIVENEAVEAIEEIKIVKAAEEPKTPEKAIIEEEAPAKPAPKLEKKKKSGGLAGIFTKRKLNESILQDLEDLLITSDLGLEASTEIVEKLRSEKFDKNISDQEIKEFLAEEIAEILQPVAKPLEAANKPHIVLVVGVNGNGKTTSIGKIAHNYKQDGKEVMIVAADTFRAAAVEQLQEWGKRAKVEVFTGQQNQDPASVAYQAIDKALKDNTDLVLVDTAGRLQNKHNLMQELEKINNVCKKLIPDAPHDTILVLDATTGQNAISQVEEFKKSANISGLIVTKLDGTAKGGVVVALAKKFDIAIHAVGVGEGIEDLKPFDAQDFADNLVGI